MWVQGASQRTTDPPVLPEGIVSEPAFACFAIRSFSEGLAADCPQKGFQQFTLFFNLNYFRKLQLLQRGALPTELRRNLSANGRTSNFASTTENILPKSGQKSRFTTIKK